MEIRNFKDQNLKKLGTNLQKSKNFKDQYPKIWKNLGITANFKDF